MSMFIHEMMANSAGIGLYSQAVAEARDAFRDWQQRRAKRIARAQPGQKIYGPGRFRPDDEARR